jgi:hypothetical protein
MPYDIRARGKRKDIIDWLDSNIGKFGHDKSYWSAKGMGWELLPLGGDFSIFTEPGIFIIRIWDKDKAFLTRLRWE